MNLDQSNSSADKSDETARDRIRRLQREWATNRGLSVDARGYVSDYRKNLRVNLSPRALKAFSQGADSELRDGPNDSPAKMRALHSSSALAVNVFDYWVTRDASPLLGTLGIEGTVASMEFETPLKTGFGGIPPHLDVLFRLDGGRLVGVEAKYTEWMSKKSKQPEKLIPYFHVDGTSFWSRAGLDGAHTLAKSIVDKRTVFEVLDVPQLLKHILGLRVAAVGKPWSLLYVYYAGAGEIAELHATEIQKFTDAVGAAAGFTALSYQTVFASLAEVPGNIDQAYMAYVRERYFTP